ncbi:MAG: hypothetical protein H7099_05610 [Gemmatimonadaceae bacterium]|nr:hypothetical protein [Gemmatimonadaceae bacterium]
MAWRIACSQELFREHFQLHQPETQASIGLLDKKQLYAHAEACGVPYPRTYAPTSSSDVRDIADTLDKAGGLPVIVKPRTQAGGQKSKGEVATTPKELIWSVDQFRQPGRYSAEFLRDAPADIEWPLIQQFMPEAAGNTYSLSGFIDQAGSVVTARASTKVFQIPVQIGIGVAFEGRALRSTQLEAIESIARASGYFGVFEAEFIHSVDGTLYLMDFNPRYYGQMSFEMSRGMRLPSIAFAAATGSATVVKELLAHSQKSLRSTDASQQRFCDRFLFRTLLRTQYLNRRLDAEVRDRWLQWMQTGEVSDFLVSDDDPAPTIVDRSTRWRAWLRHPLSSYGVLFR